MITTEQAMDVLEKFRENKPTKFFNKVDEISAGMTFVLVYLSEHREGAYASTIADQMHISRARVAVLIQKLLAKGWVEQSTSSDARIKTLQITEAGLQEVGQFKQQMLGKITKVIEVLGIKKVYKFLETSKKIKNIIEDMEQ